MENILNTICGESWAITPEALDGIIKIADRCYAEKPDPSVFHADIYNKEEALLTIGGDKMEGSRNAILRGSVAVLPILGPIFPRANMMTNYSGATALSVVARDLRLALEAPEIETVLFYVDSPGGAVIGTSEFASLVKDARGIKKIITYAAGYMASGAYWIGSASSEVVAADTALIGSIGVLLSLQDTRKAQEKQGVENINIVSTQSPKKVPDPKSDTGRKDLQTIVNDLADVFVSSVASQRGVDKEKVLNDFGQGDVLIASKAVEAGMADRIGSFEEIITAENDSNINQNTGGLLMSANSKEEFTMTAEAVLESSPETYNAILQKGIAQGKAEGTKAESDRIQGIESIKAPGYENIVNSVKHDPEMTKEKVAAVILEKQEEKRQASATAIEADAAEAAEAASGLDQNQDSADDTEMAAAIDAIAAGGNSHASRKAAGFLQS